MTRDEAVALVKADGVGMPANSAADLWLLEENKSNCRVTFAEGKITRAKKVINN